MNLADFLGSRWLSMQIPYEHFETVEFKCRTCWRLDPPSCGRHEVFRATRSELVDLGARVVDCPPHSARPEHEWLLVVPFRVLALRLIEHHLFHEIEVLWDRRFIGERPLGIDSLADGKVETLALTPHGPLPTVLMPPASWTMS